MDELVGPAKPQKRKKEPSPIPEETTEPPKKKAKNMKYVQLLRNIPDQPSYEWSFSHLSELSHLLVAKSTEFVISVSIDGYIKFWKRTFQNLEFVKLFRPTKTRLLGCCVSDDGKYFAILCENLGLFSIKIFDVVNVVLIHIIELQFEPSNILFVVNEKDLKKIVVTEKGRNSMFLFALDSDGKYEKKIETFHKNNEIMMLRYNRPYRTIVTVDFRGIVEYVCSNEFVFPFARVNFKMKSRTDLFEFAKSKSYPVSLEFSKDGNKFVCMGKDRFIRVFDFLSGRMIMKIDETVQRMKIVQLGGEEKYQLHGLDFGKRMEIEKQYEKHAPFHPVKSPCPLAPSSNVLFDESGYFIIYPTALGLKVVNIVSNKVERLLGKHEHNYRFSNLSMFQGRVKIDRNKLAGLENFQRKYSIVMDATLTSFDLELDPMILCCAFKKNRFFMFSTRVFDEYYLKEGISRDVVNESDYQLNKLELIKKKARKRKVLPTGAILHTDKGDIKMELFPNECPLAVENFVVHARNGYYNDVIFHRIIKNFMIQTGDPTGDGTGGTSIWGGNFKDEINTKVTHDKAYRVSMANTGEKNTNGSQFFITTAETKWLDGKHSLFGSVVEGMDVVKKIQLQKCNKYDKPWEDIKIISVTVIGDVEEQTEQ